ncbi:MAG: hypothetical protein H6717_13375 [Polyangiaceae bacterium]|nr:hypothetical protein [Polyangiaceae bacterium]
MSLILTALIVGGGLVAAGIGTRLALRRKPEKPEGDAPSKPAAKSSSGLAEAGFRVDVGDVISVRGRELWLAQGWLLREGGEAVAAVLFSDQDVVVALPPPDARLALLTEVSANLPDEPPASIEVKGVRYERVRRLPVELAALADTQPPPWNAALFCEYRGLGGEQLWIVGHGAFSRAFQGSAISDDDFEMWGKASG